MILDGHGGDGDDYHHDIGSYWMILDEHGDDGNQDDHNHEADQSDQNGEMKVLPPLPFRATLICHVPILAK